MVREKAGMASVSTLPIASFRLGLGTLLLPPKRRFMVGVGALGCLIAGTERG